MVVFDKGNSYIVDKTTWNRTRIDERNGAYVFDIWIPKAEEQRVPNTGKYQALMEDSSGRGNNQLGFVGLDDLF